MDGAHSLPGTELLRQASSFGMPDSAPPPADAKNLPRASNLGGSGGGGGIRGSTGSNPARPSDSITLSDDEFYGSAVLGDHNPEPVPDPIEEQPQAECINIGWCEPETKFETDAEVFAEFMVPDSEKGRTLVDFELLRLVKGEFEAVETGQGHCDESGRACVFVPIRKPKPESKTNTHGQEPKQTGSTETTLEATFAIRVRHCTATDQAWATKKETERVVKETAEEFFEHEMVSGLHFVHNKSFIPGSYIGLFKQFESKFKGWTKKYPDGRLIVFGHAEKDEKNPRELSQRRAKIAAAFLMGDYPTWAKIAESEGWGCWEQQSVLKAMGFLEVDEPSGKYDAETQGAAEKFVEWLNKHEGKKYNPKLGLTESYIREDLYRLYVTGARRKVQFSSDDFRLVAGNNHMGCGCFNRYMAGNASRPENRRATLLFVAERENFPKTFPCKGILAPCEQEASKPGKRRFEGFKCKFYDDLAEEEKADVKEPHPPIESDESQAYSRVKFPGYEGMAYIIKDFKKYEGAAIQLTPKREVIQAGAPMPPGFNNQCVAFVRYFGLPATGTWKKGPRVCDLEAGHIQEGTVIATLRDGYYHSDATGRSHVGIYLNHDSYQHYSEKNDKTFGILMMDQSKGNVIDRSQKRYSADADKKGKSTSKPWVDAQGNTHNQRVNWVNDGEEYFVVLTNP